MSWTREEKFSALRKTASQKITSLQNCPLENCPLETAQRKSTLLWKIATKIFPYNIFSP